jgi:hypothetical protein
MPPLSSTKRIKQEYIHLPSLPALIGNDRSEPSYALFQAIDIGRSVLVVCCCDINPPQFSSLVVSAPLTSSSLSTSSSVRTLTACSKIIDDGLSSSDEAESVSRAINAIFMEKLVLLSWNVPESMPDLAREVIKKALIKWLKENAETK